MGFFQVGHENQELKVLLSRRDADMARLRETRDQQLAELNERKQKDGIKWASLQEFKSLVASQAVRLFPPKWSHIKFTVA